jgi:DMSO/TMAO reductase YedYZ molybdopterin-dependent catalytic subunit
MKRRTFLTVILSFLAACTGQPLRTAPSGTQLPSGTELPSGTKLAETQDPVLTPSVTPLPGGLGPTAGGAADDCQLPAVTRPTAAPNPGYTQLDPSTGLHITGTAQVIDQAEWRLLVGGKVQHPLSLSYDDLRCLPRRRANVNISCAGYFEDFAEWAGTPLKTLLEQAQPLPEAEMVELVSADHYSSILTVPEAMQEQIFLAYEWAGKPLPVLHGFPVRAIVPGMAGAKSTKWLVEIKIR